ncbi:MAG TPA: GGDEF domain-containing response regulator [Thermoanaerobaculia bacterium]|nr:GGDEF domain-containing response regulator [Thermoanaerobaculia bacterium]
MSDEIKILIVEDDPAAAHLIKGMLASSTAPRFTTQHATTLREALEVVADLAPDLILLDLDLPDSSELNGLERLQEATPETPILILTGHEEDALAVGTLQRGAEDFLIKGSVQRAGLTRSIRYAIERHHGLRELARVSKQLHAANIDLERLALIDPLTELLNRRGLQQALSRENERLQRDGTEVLALMVDIDDFKGINESMGHSVGDIALREITRKLRASVRGVDSVGRLGGDEFLLLMPKARAAEASRIAERLRLRISTTSIQSSAGPIKITASIGAMMLSAELTSIDEVLTHMQGILHRSKQEGKNRVTYGGDTFDDTDRREKTQVDMCTSLARGDKLVSVKQPLFRLVDEKIIGYEFLSRYFGGTLEMPDTFFRICSERNTVSLVDHHCLKKALEICARMPDEGRFHVNLFPSTIVGIPTQHLLEEFPAVIPLDCFCIEISEQQILGEPSYLIEPVRALKNAGIKIAIDDVGYGNSCVESLVLLEPDIIKIDKRCVMGIENDVKRIRHLERYVGIARQLGAEVIAEGIETRAALEIVKNIGVEFGQGFLWGMPA